MKKDLSFSIIVPVYNRPDEVRELLESLKKQTFKTFEVLIIEDGSTEKCEDVCDLYRSDLKFWPGSEPQFWNGTGQGKLFYHIRFGLSYSRGVYV